MANDVTKMQKNPGVVWYGLSVPAAGMYVTIGTDGVPDATQNPNAKMIGMTESGSTLTISKSFVQEFVDEYKAPIEETVDQTGMMIKTSPVQVMDFDLFEQATTGAGTKTTGTGKTGVITVGEAPINYSGWAVVFPLKSNAAKFGVFHIYKGFNRSNVEFQISRQNRANIPLEISGVAITSRASNDQLGCWWAMT